MTRTSVIPTKLPTHEHMKHYQKIGHSMTPKRRAKYINEYKLVYELIIKNMVARRYNYIK
jgi:hypothetical protein